MNKPFSLLAVLMSLATAAVLADELPKDKTKDFNRSLSEKFAKAYLVDKSADDVMKLVALPHFFGWSDLTAIIENENQLKSDYSYSMKHSLGGAKGKDDVKVIDMWTYERFLKDTELGRKLPLENFAHMNKVLKKTDHLVHVRVNSGKPTVVKHFDLYVMIRQIDKSPKVIGFLDY